MTPSDASRALEDLSRELDLIVYSLERPLEDRDPVRERAVLRRNLERLREQLDDLARALG
ncbi:MAG: hypothetical protein KTR31_04200 [Myxococcales bacterium]|nr:hypothetical protein [Myxococcales bacterium]